VSPAQAGRIVRRLVAADGTVRDDVGAAVVAGLSRSELKVLLGSLRRDLRRRSVVVEVAGTEAPARQAAERRYAGASVDVHPNPGMGAGIRYRAGDDIVDASVRGAIRRIIAELGST
jgi:hypothetical protein